VEYCKLHRASKLVYESFRHHAEPSQAVPNGFAAIENFEQRQRGLRYRWLYAVGGAAAAVACLSVFSMRYVASNAVDETPALQVASAQSAVAVAANRLPPMGRSDAGQVPRQTDNLLSLRNTFALEIDLQSWLAAWRAGQRNPVIEAAGPPSGRLDPLFNDKVFAGNEQLQVSLPRTYSPQNSPVPPASREFAAFQFQR
jgi:hypothetical protein